MRRVLGDGLVADEAAKIAREQRQLRLGLRAVLRVAGDAEAENRRRGGYRFRTGW
jgi:hypothetical protein